SEGRPSHTSIVNSTNSTSSRCQLHPALTCVPATMRPFGMRAEPPAWAAFAAATCPGVVSATRKVSLATASVAVAEDDGDVEECPHPLPSSPSPAVAAANRTLTRQDYACAASHTSPQGGIRGPFESVAQKRSDRGMRAV